MFFLETNQQFICCRLQRNAFSIYLPYFTNDFSKQFLVFAGKHLAYLTDKTKSGQMSEINGISEQQVLSKFIVAMCIRVRVPSKKKTRGILSITERIFRQTRMRCTIYNNEKAYLVYQLLFEINCHRASRLSGLSGLYFLFVRMDL